jgi:hypothetical protein
LKTEVRWKWAGPYDEHYVSSVREIPREIAAGFNVDSERTIYGSAFTRANSSYFDGEFDPGSGRTLAACLTHASRTRTRELALCSRVADG